MRISLHLFRGFLEIFTSNAITRFHFEVTPKTSYPKINKNFPQFENVAVLCIPARLGSYIPLPGKAYTVFPNRCIFNLLGSYLFRTANLKAPQRLPDVYPMF